MHVCSATQLTPFRSGRNQMRVAGMKISLTRGIRVLFLSGRCLAWKPVLLSRGGQDGIELIFSL